MGKSNCSVMLLQLLLSLLLRGSSSNSSSSSSSSNGIAIPIQAWTGPECSRRLRFPDFVMIDTLRSQCQPYPSAGFTPRKYSWYSFLLEAESTSGP